MFESSRAYDVTRSEVDACLEEGKHGIESVEHPSFGYRTVAHLLRMNKNTV